MNENNYISNFDSNITSYNTQSYQKEFIKNPKSHNTSSKLPSNQIPNFKKFDSKEKSETINPQSFSRRYQNQINSITLKSNIVPRRSPLTSKLNQIPENRLRYEARSRSPLFSLKTSNLTQKYLLNEESAILLGRVVFQKYNTKNFGYLDTEDTSEMISRLYETLNIPYDKNEEEAQDFMVANDLVFDGKLSLKKFEKLFSKILSTGDSTGMDLFAPVLSPTRHKYTTHRNPKSEAGITSTFSIENLKKLVQNQENNKPIKKIEPITDLEENTSSEGSLLLKEFSIKDKYSYFDSSQHLDSNNESQQQNRLNVINETKGEEREQFSEEKIPTDAFGKDFTDYPSAGSRNKIFKLKEKSISIEIDQSNKKSPVKPSKPRRVSEFQLESDSTNKNSTTNPFESHLFKPSSRFVKEEEQSDENNFVDKPLQNVEWKGAKRPTNNNFDDVDPSFERAKLNSTGFYINNK